MMKVLIACEYSGIVRDAFTAKGHEAWSCDILPSETEGNHHEGFLEDVIGSGREWDLIIGHPPCTRLCNSGVRWLGERNLWNELSSATAFFNMIKGRDCPRIAIENPIPHKYAVKEIGKYDQIVQPWQFGHGETKAICLWLKGLPPLISTQIVEGREARVHKMAPGKDRQKERSRFYTGIAEAMANQWNYESNNSANAD